VQSSIVEGGGQPHSSSGNVAPGIPVRIHKRIMGALTRNKGNDKRSLFVVLVATSISATWQWDDAAHPCCIVASTPWALVHVLTWR
jgi:hypothetical protein